MHPRTIGRASGRRLRQILTASSLLLGGTASPLFAQAIAPHPAEFGEAQGLKAAFFPAHVDLPWIHIEVADARRERLKIGFFRLGLVPVLVLHQVSLDLDLSQFDTTISRRWLEGDFGLATPRQVQIGPIQITLRRGAEIVWSCTAKEAVLGQAGGLILRQVKAQGGPGEDLRADSASITLTPTGSQLQVVLLSASGYPNIRDFSLSTPQD